LGSLGPSLNMVRTLLTSGDPKDTYPDIVPPERERYVLAAVDVVK